MSLLIWISPFVAFKELGVTLANSSPHAEGTPLKVNQLDDL